MTVWALCEARAWGYEVDDAVLQDMVKWTKERLLARIDLPRDTRPGWSMVSTPAIYLAVLSRATPGQEAVSADERQRIVGHLLRHQEEDGSWAWSSAPPKNRPPPFFESDEVATLLGLMALDAAAEGETPADVRGAQEKAEAWLADAPPTGTTQALAMRLLRGALDKLPADALQPEVAALMARQNDDGGWGQLQDAPSDAYATGQVTYVLTLAGVPADGEALRRAIDYLVRTQQPDGSWPMNPRAHPGATPSTNLVPIIHLGTAWATLGLVRAEPVRRPLLPDVP
jgi:hypothetical protein